MSLFVEIGTSQLQLPSDLLSSALTSALALGCRQFYEQRIRKPNFRGKIALLCYFCQQFHIMAHYPLYINQNSISSCKAWPGGQLHQSNYLTGHSYENGTKMFLHFVYPMYTQVFFVSKHWTRKYYLTILNDQGKFFYIVSS